MEVITFIGTLLLRRSVLLVVILGGIVFAIVRWKRHPRVSLMTVLALVLYLIESFVFAMIYHWLPRYFFSLGITPHNMRVVDALLQLTEDFTFCAILILLTAAAFAQRHALTGPIPPAPPGTS